MTSEERRAILRPLADAFPVGFTKSALDVMIRELAKHGYTESDVAGGVARAVAIAMDKFFPAPGKVIDRCNDARKERYQREQSAKRDRERAEAADREAPEWDAEMDRAVAESRRERAKWGKRRDEYPDPPPRSKPIPPEVCAELDRLRAERERRQKKFRPVTELQLPDDLPGTVTICKTDIDEELPF